MRRPICPAVIFVAAGEDFQRFACARRRWHRGEHRAFRTLPTWEYVACWPRDWRRAASRVRDVIQRSFRIPQIEPMDWGRR